MFCGLVVANFVNCFVIVCNMFQKVFKDCLDLKKIFELLRSCLDSVKMTLMVVLWPDCGRLCELFRDCV